MTTVAQLFVSYHPSDGDVAKTIIRRLEAQGVSVQPDTPLLGSNHHPWPQLTQARLTGVQAVAVLVGRGGLSQRQKQLIGLALEWQTRAEQAGGRFPVVPVLLPQADLAPAFLFSDNWIDLRHPKTDIPIPQLFLETAAGRAGKRPPAAIIDYCPYPGLQSFREEDAAFFFGRELVVANLLAVIQQQPVTVIVGLAGSGKTSVIQAGFLPKLRRRCSPTSWWEIICIRPGQNPFDRLAAGLMNLGSSLGISTQTNPALLGEQLAQNPATLAGMVEALLAPAGGKARLLLVVDQFEELLTLTSAPTRPPFVEALRLASKHPSLSLLLVLQAEAYSRAIHFNDTLGQWLEGRVINLRPMPPAEIRQAIQKPARLVTTAFEPGLVERLVDEAASLPLLQFCLAELWRQHQGGLLSWANYKQINGLDGAIAYRAEKTLKALAPIPPSTVRQVFRRLATISEGGAINCRQRVPLAELRSQVAWQAPLSPYLLPELAAPQYLPHFAIPKSPNQAITRAIVEAFSRAGLLTVEIDEPGGEEIVKITHPILIDKWPRLRAWLDQDYEFSLWRRRLGPALAAWEQADRREGLLLAGTTLAEAEYWLVENRDGLGLAAQAFIQQSRARRWRTQTRRWIVGLAILAALLWTTIIITMHQIRAVNIVKAERDVALTAQAQTELALQMAQERRATAEAGRQIAEQQSQLALARQLAVEARLLLNSPGGDLVRSALLAVEALRRSPSLEAGEQILRTGLTRLPRPAGRLPHPGEVWAAIFSPDGQWLATRSGPAVLIWQVATGEAVARLEHANVVNDMAFSPDGRWLVTASLDRTARIWEVASGREVARLRHNDRVWGVALSADGQWLVTRSDQTVYVWQLAPDASGPFTVGDTTGAISGKKIPLMAPGRLENGEAPPQTTISVIGRGLTRMTHDGPILAMALSPDSRWLATASADHTARIWQIATGREVTRLVHQNAVQTVAFSPNGQLLVTGSADHTARIWSLIPRTTGSATGEIASRPAEIRLTHPDNVNLITFSPDSRWLVTAGEDDLARVWLLDYKPDDRTLRAREVAQMDHDNKKIEAVAFSPDGRWLATASADHTARIWLATTGREVAQVTHSNKVNDVVFSPDGRWLATASADHTAQLWQATIGYEVSEMRHDDWVLAVGFTPDGRRLITRSGKLVQIWEAATGREVIRLDHEKYVNAVALSLDGRWLATGSYQTAQVWETATGRQIAEMAHGGLVRALAFSPDGRWLAAAGIDKVARLWDVTTGQEVAQMPHQNWVSTVTFSPDGQWLATASNDKTARVWEVPTGREVARMAHNAVVNQVAFSPDGQWLATASGDRTARIWLATTVREVARMPHRYGVFGLAFSPDGHWLATRSREFASIWDALTGQNMAEIKQGGIVEAIAFSPDSRRLATASGDRTARIWDVTTGQEIARLEHEYWVNAIAFSPDGHWLATASADRTARVWLLRQEELLAEACARLPYNLSHQEWQQYLPDQPYRATCPNLPVPEE